MRKTLSVIVTALILLVSLGASAQVSQDPDPYKLNTPECQTAYKMFESRPYFQRLSVVCKTILPRGITPGQVATTYDRWVAENGGSPAAALGPGRHDSGDGILQVLQVAAGINKGPKLIGNENVDAIRSKAFLRQFNDALRLVPGFAASVGFVAPKPPPQSTKVILEDGSIVLRPSGVPADWHFCPGPSGAPPEAYWCPPGSNSPGSGQP